jgi:RNA polymerase sigma factor (sigma-70 family)
VLTLSLCESLYRTRKELPPVVAFTVTDEPLSAELAALFREHSRLVYRTAYYVTRSTEDAEDVAQGVFLHLVRRGVPPGLRENPKGYLYRAAVNLSLTAVKSRERRALAEQAKTEWSGACASVRPASSTTNLQERLAIAIPKLNPKAVEMLVLRYEHDCTEAEIGRLLGTSRAVVAVTLFRARARLKKLLRIASGEQS